MRHGPVRTTWTTMACAALAMAAGAAVLLVGGRVGIAPEVLLRDPAQQFSFVVYAGLLSTTGVFCMIATGAITLLAATLVPSRQSLLLVVAVLSIFMGYDDQFVFHDRIAPVHLGLSSKLVMGSYALAMVSVLAYLAMRGGPVGVEGLVLSWAFLGVSAVLDLAVPYSAAVLVVEDLFKLAGYAAWLAYWTLFVRAELVGQALGEKG